MGHLNKRRTNNFFLNKKKTNVIKIWNNVRLKGNRSWNGRYRVLIPFLFVINPRTWTLVLQIFSFVWRLICHFIFNEKIDQWWLQISTHSFFFFILTTLKLNQEEVFLFLFSFIGGLHVALCRTSTLWQWLYWIFF